MEFLISAILLLLTALYCTVLMWLMAGLYKLVEQRTTPQPETSDENLPAVSVVVAARNEAHNLPRLIRCLQQQDYPEDKIEFLLVDDRSEDDSWQMLCDAENKYSQFRALQIKDTLPGYAPKKRALDRAIRSAKGGTLLLTDADCSPPKTWARSMVRNYRDGVVMVPGYSRYRFDTSTPKILQGILSLDYFSHAAVAAAGIGRGQPLTAAGCNLSYLRKTYFDAGGFESIRHWVSGDDDLFLLKVAIQKIGKFTYALQPESFVPCAAPSSLKQFWHQRIRYASKGLHYSFVMAITLIAVYVLNVSIALALPLLLLGHVYFAKIALIGWGMKSLFEYIFLSRAAAIFLEKKLLKYYLPTALLHPFYISIFALFGAVSRFEWKDKKAPKTRKVESVAHD
jgi:cellulose synthase/poly-beta-1,6-N-acetylglucosamine synthase-like glycosyltransferase